MTSEKITFYRPNEDKTELIEQLPKTIASQVYDSENEQFLDETLTTINTHTKDESAKKHIEVVSSVPNDLTESGILFKVDGSSPDVPSTITVDVLNENVLAVAEQMEDIKQIVVSIEDFPKLNVESNDTGRFQRAFEYLVSSGGGLINLPTKEYVANIKVPTNCGIVGCGRKSILKAPNSSTSSVVELLNGNVRNIYLDNFSIDGNKVNQTSVSARGLYINGNTALPSGVDVTETNDPRHFIRNIFIRNTKGNGFEVVGRGGHSVHNVQVLFSDANGIYIDSFDSTYSNLDSGANAKSGIYVKKNNNRFEGCKSWNNGQYSGFDINDGFGFYLDTVQGTVIVGSEAQSNYHHGFYLLNCNNTIIFANSEDNGAGASGAGLTTAESCGFALSGSKRCTIIGGTRNVASDFQEYSVGLYNYSDNNNIILSSYLMKVSAVDNPQNRTTNNLQIFGDKELKESNFDYLTLGTAINRALTRFQVFSKRGEQITTGVFTRNFNGNLTEDELLRLQAYDGTSTYHTISIRHSMETGTTTINIPTQLNVNKSLRIGNGSWNGQHLIMGSTHVWFDSSGRLRVKNGAPTSETDGIVHGSFVSTAINAVPVFIGQMAVVSDVAYIATGTSSTSDWKQITN